MCFNGRWRGENRFGHAMTGYFCFATILGSVFVTSLSAEVRQQNRPNVVIILADDMGYSDIGAYGSEVATPNLDRLASEGIKFSQFYSNPRCCPSRASLLTGLYPTQTGVGYMCENWRPPNYGAGLDARCVTIADLLHNAGYATYQVGKWHVGELASNGPQARGFDHSFSTTHGGSHFCPTPLLADGLPFQAEETDYSTDLYTEKAVKFLRDHKNNSPEKAFFLYLAYTAPHFPLQALPDDIKKYRHRYTDGWDVVRARRFESQKKLGLLPSESKLPPLDPVIPAWDSLSRDEKDDWDLRMAVYAGMIDHLDRGIGRVLESLKKTGEDSNTIVIFLSDNGASAEALDSWPEPTRGHRPGTKAGEAGSHRCLEAGWASVANTPLREFKIWTHEGGTSVPFIVRWPNNIQPGTSSDQVGQVMDVMPTILQLAGVEYPKEYRGSVITPVEGQSLVPIFQGLNLTPRDLFWEHEGNAAILSNGWKLVRDFQAPWELYEVGLDRSESHNMAAQYPEKVESLNNAWVKWSNRVGIIPWEDLPGADYKPTSVYRRKSEPPLQ